MLGTGVLCPLHRAGIARRTAALYTIAMRTLLVLAVLLAAASLADAARKKRTMFVDREPGPTVVREQDPEARLAAIVRKIERGDLPKIEFEFDSSEIRLESYDTLSAILELLYDNPKLKLMIRAHTCSMGSDEYNLDLSERRAKSVKSWLTQRGIDPPTVRYRGIGEAEPAADNSTEEGRVKNRRVEFRVTFRGWNSVY